MLRKLPFLLIAIILAVVVLDPVLPLALKEGIYAASLTIKSLILFVLPFIIFSLLFSSMVQLSSRATGIIAFVLVGLCISNFFGVMVGNFVGTWVYGFDLSVVTPPATGGLAPMCVWEMPSLVPNDRAMFAGIILGIAGAFLARPMAHKVGVQLERWVHGILRAFPYLIPVFVAGFVIKMQADGAIVTIFNDYTAVFAVVALAQLGYLFFLYGAVNAFNRAATIRSLKNMVAPAISGFATMSSGVTMPLTIIAVESNTKHKELAASVIPATVNVHLLGNSIGIPILAYAVMKSFGAMEPSFSTSVAFALSFVLAQFSSVCVPGGGILVMFPILEQYFGFNAPMLSLITALHLLFNPMMTCANVLGNGVFAQFIDKLASWMRRKPSSKGGAPLSSAP